MNAGFDLFLFSKDEMLIPRAIAAGVRGLVIDWENKGKYERQSGADTQINHDTLEDLRAARRNTSGRILCRINGPDVTSREEIEDAIEGGADEILVPMVRSASQVDKILEIVGGRCGVGILVETQAAVDHAADLGRLPITRVYVGLNDLSIERRTGNLFAALIDDTVARIRDCFPMPFGVGGVTLPGGGDPIPCRLLIGELARLNCSFSFMRRSFVRDIQGRDVKLEVHRILEALAQAFQRDAEQVAEDRDAFVRTVIRQAT